MCEEALLRDTQVKFKPVLLSPKTDFKHPPHTHTHFLMNATREATGV